MLGPLQTHFKIIFHLKKHLVFFNHYIAHLKYKEMHVVHMYVLRYECTKSGALFDPWIWDPGWTKICIRDPG